MHMPLWLFGSGADRSAQRIAPLTSIMALCIERCTARLVERTAARRALRYAEPFSVLARTAEHGAHGPASIGRGPFLSASSMQPLASPATHSVRSGLPSCTSCVLKLVRSAQKMLAPTPGDARHLPRAVVVGVVDERPTRGPMTAGRQTWSSSPRRCPSKSVPRAPTS